MSNSKTIKTNPKVHLQQHIQFPSFTLKDGLQTSHDARLQEANEKPGSERHGSEPEASSGEAGKVDRFTQTFASKGHLATTTSYSLPLVSGTEPTTASPPLFSAAHTPQITAVTKYILPTVMLAPTSPLHHTKSDLPLPEEKQDETGLQRTPLFQPWSVGRQEPTETSVFSLSASAASLPASSALSFSPPVPTFTSPTSQSNMKTHLSYAVPPSEAFRSTKQRSQLTGFHSFTMSTSSKAPMPSVSLGSRPVCPYPPVPAHGTFYFRNVENPGPREYRHYIQYACYPGYTLAHGDTLSYCQQGGTWSGITPVCLDLTPCLVNNGGCSQLCSHSHYYNQMSNQSETRTQCHCTPGFILLDDGRTCRDVDECMEGLHRCQQRCINTLGSFRCGCNDGYKPARDQAACTDVDECLLPIAVTGCGFVCVNTQGSFYCLCPPGYSLTSADSHCQALGKQIKKDQYVDECAINQGLGPCMELCHNSPGSYRCACTHGHALAGDGHSCIAECPPGYKKEPASPAKNSTSQVVKCVDVNECQEKRCEWKCVNLPGLYRCICPRGYTLQKDGQHCKDINECSQKNGGCSHLCVNQKGGYKCACPASHRLSTYSWKKCLPRATANTAG
ncbi:hypothetical protein Q5P01_006479 [Channa striata]|uniref:Uncharacterized protein n=1 Tax=Channa striata TaxID=64152 RepID=A0AA88SYS8_CHASR|nr:hypothetical protein Q5P01_006479 [Channa striata]